MFHLFQSNNMGKRLKWKRNRKKENKTQWKKNNSSKSRLQKTKQKIKKSLPNKVEILKTKRGFLVGMSSKKFIPAILKPDFDLSRFNIRENRTLPNKLLPSQRTRLWAFSVNPLQSLHLLRCIPYILAWIHLLISMNSKRHDNQPNKQAKKKTQ